MGINFVKKTNIDLDLTFNLEKYQQTEIIGMRILDRNLLCSVNCVPKHDKFENYREYLKENTLL